MTNTNSPSDQAVEAVARAIEPIVFRSWTDLRDYCIRQGDSEAEAVKIADATHGPDIAKARDKARAALAAIPASPPSPAGDAERVNTAVSSDDAIKFLESACRNWDYVRFDKNDVADVAGSLSAFLRQRLAALQPSPSPASNDHAELIERWSKVSRYCSAAQGGVDKQLADDTVDALQAITTQHGNTDLIAAAVNQNDAMRQELAQIGNLVSDMARAVRVDQANDDGSWPDLAGRIQKVIDALQAMTASPRELEIGKAERNNALLLASICQKVRHSSASVEERDDALRNAATMLRTFARRSPASNDHAGLIERIERAIGRETLNMPLKASSVTINTLRLAADALQSLSGASAREVEWQDIATAPKDKWFLGYWPECADPQDRQCATVWQDYYDGGRFVDNSDWRMAQPTHWMPQPTPPALEQS